MPIYVMGVRDEIPCMGAELELAYTTLGASIEGKCDLVDRDRMWQAAA
jgi:hypothetical protein